MRGRLDAAAQRALLAEAEAALALAPLRRPMAPWGKPLSVRMSNAGALGWVTDRSGYRYQPAQPGAGGSQNGGPWPPIPPSLLALWADLFRAEAVAPPDCCLINHYPPGAKLGLHRDDTEAETTHPVVSVSLGDAATFRIGGLKRSDPTRSITLESGDVYLLAGARRLLYHGVDRIKRRAPNLLDAHPLFDDGAGGGRLSFTLRVAGATALRA
ncbi:MAG: alpha-ketoglutarate-dependent dioxygenase AlkB [Pseudomonadota bacterium]